MTESQTIQSQAQLAKPDDPIDNDQLDCLLEVSISTFAAAPVTVGPFDQGSTLRWNVTVPTRCRAVRIMLNGRSVASSATMRVTPATTTTYTLSAGIRGATRRLGSVTVQVDTNACLTAPVPGSLIRTQLRDAIDQMDRADDRFSQRSPARVNIDAGGIKVALRFRVSIDNFADPDVNIDFAVGLRVRNGAAEPFYKSFSADVDWPWWVTVVTAGASKIVEEFLDRRIERALKPQILQVLQQQLDAVVAQLPANLRLFQVVLAPDEILVTACPAGDTPPFLVL